MRLPKMRPRPCKPTVNRAFSRAIESLKRELTGPDEDRRRAFVEHLDREAIPAVRTLVIDRLVVVLKRKRSEDICRCAAEALVGLGESATAALRYHLLSTRTPQVQLQLVEILSTTPATSEFTPSLDPAIEAVYLKAPWLPAFASALS